MVSLITISFIICLFLFLFLFLSLSPTLSLPFSLLLCLFFSFSLTLYLNFSPYFAISLSSMFKYLLLPFHECNSNSNAAKAVRSRFGPHICGNSLDICGTFHRYYLIDFSSNSLLVLAGVHALQLQLFHYSRTVSFLYFLNTTYILKFFSSNYF